VNREGGSGTWRRGREWHVEEREGVACEQGGREVEEREGVACEGEYEWGEREWHVNRENGGVACEREWCQWDVPSIFTSQYLWKCR
jgi:hypothetical protein